VSVYPGSFQALPEQTDKRHCGAWKILTIITQLIGAGPAGVGPARAGGTGEEGPSEGD